MDGMKNTYILVQSPPLNNNISVLSVVIVKLCEMVIWSGFFKHIAAR